MADIPMRPGVRTDLEETSATGAALDARTVLINRISWGAVFAGVAVELVTQLLLNMLGIGIGAATIDPATGQTPGATGFSITAAIWWTVSGIIAAFLGGLTAGRLAGRPKGTTAAWHGLVAWALTTLIVLYLITTTVGSILGGAFSVIGNAASGLTKTATEAAAPIMQQVEDPFAAIEREIRSATGAGSPEAARDAAVAAVRAAVTGDRQAAEEARKRATEALAKAQNVSPDQARQQIDQYEQRFTQAAQQAEQQARKAADATASAVSSAALGGFVALVLGAIAGWFGGRSGAVPRT